MEHIVPFMPLFAGLLFLAGVVQWKRWGDRRRRERREIVSGFRGWLRVFLGFLILAAVANAGSLLRNLLDFETREPALAQTSGYVSYKAFCWLLLFATTVWQFWVAYRLLTRHEPQSVVHVKRWLIGAPVVCAIADVAAAWLFMGANSSEQAVGQLMGVLFYNVGWYWYFCVSERVQNTYCASPVRSSVEGTALHEPVLAWTPDPPLGTQMEPAVLSTEGQGGTAGASVWWYLDASGQRKGPVTLDELAALSGTDALGAESRAWREGLLAWKPVQEILNLPEGRLPAVQEGEPSFIRQALLREQPASGLSVAVAVTLAVLLVLCSLAVYDAGQFSLSYSLGRGVGALLVPGAAVVLYSLFSDTVNQRKKVRVFAAGCALMLLVSGTNVFMSHGYFDRLARKDSMTAEEFMAQAAQCARQGDLRCQEASWREAVRLRPDDAVAMARLGIVLNRRGKHEEAIGHFKRSIELGTGAYDLFAYYADSHERLGHGQEAIEWSYKALSVAPDLVDVRARLAQLLTRAHKPYEALSLLQSYDSRRSVQGEAPYFTAQRIAIETVIGGLGPDQSGERSALRLPVYGGHFFAPVTLGQGKPLAFMIDTGASMTTVSEELLRASKAVYRVTDPQVRMRTADGRTMLARGILIDSMKVGPFELAGVPALTCPDCASLLGQASLTHFDMQSSRTQGVEFLLLAQRRS
ncbi:retroviral-like aspartic protease family protein [Acidovorax sacchari]|uniref:retroviral-like aspartic protease family protein n=1 Tax=Acidovorax sacchari TaxID=3230736 RepID=UPI0039E6E5B3